MDVDHAVRHLPESTRRGAALHTARGGLSHQGVDRRRAVPRCRPVGGGCRHREAWSRACAPRPAFHGVRLLGLPRAASGECAPTEARPQSPVLHETVLQAAGLALVDRLSSFLVTWER